MQLCGDTTLEPGEAIVARAAYDAYDVLGGDASLAPALGALAAHSSHFVRWAATQSLLCLAPGMGRQGLQVLAVDPHPQLRMAARYRLAATPG